MSCEYNYTEITKTNSGPRYYEDKKQYWKLLFRQIWVNSGIWVSFFIAGLTLGAPAVFIPQLQANSNKIISVELTSWLSSAMAFAQIPWMMIIAPMCSYFGRKWTQMIACIISFFAFLLFYNTDNPMCILFCDIILGSISACGMCVGLMISTECSSPKYRGIFLTMKTASLYWGIWIANIVGTFFHYKYIPLIGMLCAVYNIIVNFWSESPYWLASKGFLDESIQKLQWMKGTGVETKKEIDYFIQLQAKEIRKQESVCHRLKTVITDKKIYKPILIGFCLALENHFSGKMACSVYAIQIIKNITKNEATAYQGMLLLDGVCVFSMYTGSVITRYLKRRTHFFCSAWLCNTFLFILSVYLFLKEFSVLVENSAITIGILAGFSISSSAGTTVLCTSVLAELMPLKFKSTALCICGAGSGIFWGLVLKITPYLFQTFGSHGAFLFFGCFASFFTLILMWTLPETTNKTLQEIADSYDSKTNVNTELNKINEI